MRRIFFSLPAIAAQGAPAAAIHSPPGYVRARSPRSRARAARAGAAGRTHELPGECGCAPPRYLRSSRRPQAPDALHRLPEPDVPSRRRSRCRIAVRVHKPRRTRACGADAAPRGESASADRQKRGSIPGAYGTSFLRPFARRRLKTRRPPFVAMRARNPWVRLRRTLLGW
jgi:hypothetical protein